MSWSYAYDPHLWPAFISAVLLAALGWYTWGRRDVPGARSLAIAAAFSVLWIAGIILEGAATEPPTKIFWFLFKEIWLLPVVTAVFCFIIQYARPGWIGSYPPD